MKLLRPFTGTGAVFFPYGKPPYGTCEYATDECVSKCYQMNPNYPNYDEEILILNGDKKLIYDAFINDTVESLYERIIDNLDGLQTPILHWFGSGDCLSKDIDKIDSVIDRVRQNEDIIQMGFTRNIKLWENHKDIFALSIDKKEDALGSGMYSIPYYDEEMSMMYSRNIFIHL